MAYEDIKKERLLKTMGLENNPVVLKPEEIEFKEDEVYGVIFAPNPITGFPDSSLELQLSKKTEKNIREYLEQFNKALAPTGGTSDSDLALETTQPYQPTPEQIEGYYQSLFEIANESNEN